MVRPKVLVLSRSYPNNVLEVQGLWVENLVRHSANFCEPKVISPVPYCPPVPGLSEYYKRFRRIPPHRFANGIDVFHPRLLLGPGYALHSIEWFFYYLTARRVADRLRRDFPFDLIHAHYTYPDGCVAVRLGRRYSVPVIITEQNPWLPWMEDNTIVRREVTRAAKQCSFHVAISNTVRESIVRLAGDSDKLVVIPDGVDGTVFSLPAHKRREISNQILFVGAIRPVKGVDILLRAMRSLVDSGKDVNLVLVGESFFKNYQREYQRLQVMAKDLGLGSRVLFAGKKRLSELVCYIQESALLVLPSRAESLGMVLVEALACGTPVVATRCGGPEDIITDEVGVLVQTNDPEELARGISQVLDRRDYYDPARLRAHALKHFGLDVVGNRLADLYRQVLRPSYDQLSVPSSENSFAKAESAGDKGP